MFCIYVFSDEWGVPQYVGKAQDLDERIHKHLYYDRFRYSHTHFYRWLNKQIREDKQFFIDPLEDANLSNWREKETFWIKHIKDAGYPLTNMTDGGDGNNNQVFTEESKRRRSERMMGHSVSEETRKRISNSHKGKHLSEETKQKLSEINKGKPCLETTKQKFSKALNQYNLNGEFIKTFPSLTSAANSLGCKKSSLSGVIKRKKNGKFMNYLWKYKNE